MSGSTHVAQRHPPCPNPARLFDLTCRIRPLIASGSGLPGFSPRLGRTNICHKPRPLVTERARSARKAIHDTYRCTSCVCVTREGGEQGLWRYRRPNLRRSERFALGVLAGRAPPAVMRRFPSWSGYVEGAARRNGQANAISEAKMTRVTGVCDHAGPGRAWPVLRPTRTGQIPSRPSGQARHPAGS